MSIHQYPETTVSTFVVYADFESILQRVGDGAMDTTQGVAAGDDGEHLPSSFAYNLVRSVVPEFSRPLISYRGEGAVEMFVRKLQEEAELLFHDYIATPQQRLALTGAELRSFHTAINCHICNQSLGGEKVRDHCHIVGSYRCAAYIISKSEWKLPVVIHKLKGYAGHLIVKALKSEFGEVRVIPQNMDKYLSITVGRLKFIDSLQIMDSSARFNESRLPSQDAFFSKLSDSLCSDTEYVHATQMWTAFEFESMAVYHDIYLK